jgi:hypothetical protein
MAPSLATLGMLLAALALTVPTTAPAQLADCSSEAALIRRAEAELPRLDVAPPADRQIVCITLETNLLFAKRLSAHLAQCPRSPLAKSGGAWAKTGKDYTAQFSSRGCKQTIKGYRG